MKIISLVNQKGGCGKTTSAVNLAYALAKKGQRVWLVDLDPQAHTSFSLGITPRLTTADLLENVISNHSINLDDYLIQRANNLFVLSSSIGLSALELMLSVQKDKLEILTKLFIQIDNPFDYCIIDCPPNLGALTLNALSASGFAIVPIGICALSLKGVENLNNILKMLFERQRRIPTIFYLITQLDKRLKFSDNFSAKVKEQFGNQLLSTMIRTNVSLRQAAACGKSIFEYKRDSRGAEDYHRLAEEIESSTEDLSRIQFFFTNNSSNEVYLTGDFNNWHKSKNFLLKRLNQNTWGISLPLKRGTYRYKFIVDGQWIHDPENSLLESDAFGGKNSVLFVR